MSVRTILIAVSLMAGCTEVGSTVPTADAAGSTMLAKGNGNGNNGNGNGNGNADDPVDTGITEGGILTVSCIEWAKTGGRDQHIHVQAFVADQDGNPVLGAEVSMSAMKDGVEYAVVGGPTENYAGLDGGEECPGGPPGTGVTRDFCVNKAESGYYDVVVLSVTKDGYVWDGVPIENGFLHKKL